MRAIVVTYPVPKDIRQIFQLKTDDYIIAVDQAVLALYKQRIKIDLAIGDFDSLKNKGVLKTLNTIELSPIKDVTDTYQAIVEAYQLDVDAVYLIGGFGGARIEHFMGHLTLFHAFPKLVMLDDHSEITCVEKGEYPMSTDGYISFYAYPEATISLKNFKYELDHYALQLFDNLAISNETKKDATLILHEGRILIVKSKKD